MTKKEFIELEQNKKAKKNIVSCAVVCYVCAAITLAASIFISELGAGILDAVILLVLGLIIHIRKSFQAAIILLVYGAINMIYMLATQGRVAGWLIVLAGIYAVIETRKLGKAWKAFQSASQIDESVQ